MFHKVCCMFLNICFAFLMFGWKTGISYSYLGRDKILMPASPWKERSKESGRKRERIKVSMSVMLSEVWLWAAACAALLLQQRWGQEDWCWLWSRRAALCTSRVFSSAPEASSLWAECNTASPSELEKNMIWFFFIVLLLLYIIQVKFCYCPSCKVYPWRQCLSHLSVRSHCFREKVRKTGKGVTEHLKRKKREYCCFQLVRRGPARFLKMSPQVVTDQLIFPLLAVPE